MYIYMYMYMYMYIDANVIKAANLARWFPPLTVTGEQWSSISRSAVSGIHVAVDTLLFSRIGVPLFHRYRVFDRPGTHGAFRGTYMRRMHVFLEESDAASLRQRHRRILQHGCRGHLFGTRKTGRQMFLLDTLYLDGRSPGSGGSGLFVSGHGNCSPSSF